MPRKPRLALWDHALSFLRLHSFILPQEGRTPLHYAAALQGTTGGVNRLYNRLVEGSKADENVVDVVSDGID